MATSLLKMLIHEYQESGRSWAVYTISRPSMQELVSQRLGHGKFRLIASRKMLSVNQFKQTVILLSSPFIRSHYLKMNTGT